MTDASENRSYEGLVAELKDDPEGLKQALEHAFDYRGDVTLTLANGAQVEGYIFDRRTGKTLSDSTLRIMTPKDGEKVAIGYDAIRKVEFTGRDAAHGKSWETWVKKYVEKKLAGEKASIESEQL